jgi:tRNA-splicing ligase RtcB
MSELHQWLAQPLPPDVRRAVDRLRRCPDVRHVALMPDVHLAHDVCVGTVLATARTLYPAAVGGDIGCGMAALALDASAALLAEEPAAARLMAALYDAVPPNRHRAPRDLPAPLNETPLSHPTLEAVRRRDARVQLGTLGRGNHFLEFQTDDEDRLWLMVHTGSRGVGQAIRDWHLDQARARASSGSRDRPTTLIGVDAESPEGLAYRRDMDWALAYARANRDAILAAVATVMRDAFGVATVPSSRLDCHHNFVRGETHLGQPLWVHRKGAVPAAAGEPGIIPGSMGAPSFHVEGRGCPASLCSSSHGAGRAMSRDAARRAITPRELERQMRGVWFDRRHAHRLRGEAPAAYKDVHAVMRAQRDLTRIVRTLRPMLSYKGP